MVTDSQPFRFREIGAVWKFKTRLKPAFVSKIFGLIAPWVYVRFWLLADIQTHPELRPLYPRKRTCFAVPNYGQFCPSIFFEIFKFPCGHLEGSKCVRAGGGPQSRSRIRSPAPTSRDATATARASGSAAPSGCPSRVESAVTGLRASLTPHLGPRASVVPQPGTERLAGLESLIVGPKTGRIAGDI